MFSLVWYTSILYHTSSVPHKCVDKHLHATQLLHILNNLECSGRPYTQFAYVTRPRGKVVSESNASFRICPNFAVSCAARECRSHGRHCQETNIGTSCLTMHIKMQLVLTLLCVSLAAAAFIEVNELAAPSALCSVQSADPTEVLETLSLPCRIPGIVQTSPYTSKPLRPALQCR